MTDQTKTADGGAEPVDLSTINAEDTQLVALLNDALRLDELAQAAKQDEESVRLVANGRISDAEDRTRRAIDDANVRAHDLADKLVTRAGKSPSGTFKALFGGLAILLLVGLFTFVSTGCNHRPPQLSNDMVITARLESIDHRLSVLDHGVAARVDCLSNEINELTGNAVKLYGGARLYQATKFAGLRKQIEQTKCLCQPKPPEVLRLEPAVCPFKVDNGCGANCQPPKSPRPALRPASNGCAQKCAQPAPTNRCGRLRRQVCWKPVCELITDSDSAGPQAAMTTVRALKPLSGNYALAACLPSLNQSGFWERGPVRRKVANVVQRFLADFRRAPQRR
jgi:hypothetical protein